MACSASSRIGLLCPCVLFLSGMFIPVMHGTRAVRTADVAGYFFVAGATCRGLISSSSSAMPKAPFSLSRSTHCTNNA